MTGLNRLNSALRRHKKPSLLTEMEELLCGNKPSSKIFKVTGAFCDQSRPSRPFACIVSALKMTLKETADLFAEVWDPALSHTTLPNISNISCVLTIRSAYWNFEQFFVVCDVVALRDRTKYQVRLCSTFLTPSC